jgi:hypothetical protein
VRRFAFFDEKVLSFQRVVGCERCPGRDASLQRSRWRAAP